MFHINAWDNTYCHTLYGGKQLLPGQVDPTVILEMIKQEVEENPDRNILILGVATVLREIIDHPAIDEYEDYLDNTTYIVGGTSFPRGLARECMELGITPKAGWGMTETSAYASVTPLKCHMENLSEEEKLKFWTRTGWSIPFTEQRVVDDEGNEVPQDDKTVGEILFRAPYMAAGYYKNPEKTAEAWDDGYLRTGDMATVDEERNVYIVDRRKDIIKSGGEWISTQTLESLLSEHERISECAIVGVPHEKWVMS